MDSEGQASRPIHGISLASFLQMLEQERKSSTLVVNHDEEEGRFYFHEGQLIDADYAGEVGLTAANSLLAWEDPIFRVAKAEDRIHRIKEPLAHILINSATRKDEARESTSSTGVKKMAKGRLTATIQGTSVVSRLVEEIVSIPGVKHYCLLGGQGKLITESFKNPKISDFIAYSIVSGIQMREVLEAKVLHRIRVKLEDGGILLITPSGGMIVGLLLDENASIPEVFSRLRQATATK